MADPTKVECPSNNPVPEIPKQFRSSAYVSALNTLPDNNFLPILDLPKCLKLQNIVKCNTERDISLDVLELKVRSFPIPSFSLETQKQPFQGGSRTEVMGSITEFEPITISFQMDSEMLNYYTLYEWMNMVYSLEDGSTTNYCKADYQTTFHVFITNQKRKCVVGAYTFHNVIPQSLGGFPMDNTTAGEDIYLDFTFDYDYMTFQLKDGTSDPII